jgi:hypothetical protein
MYFKRYSKYKKRIFELEKLLVLIEEGVWLAGPYNLPFNNGPAKAWDFRIEYLAIARCATSVVIHVFKEHIAARVSEAVEDMLQQPIPFQRQWKRVETKMFAIPVVTCP